MADISTLHAFCADALRSYFYVLGLEPNFSVAEDSVAQELKNDAFDRVAESELNAEDEVYLRLVEMLGKKSEQTSFKQTVFRLYDFLCADLISTDGLKKKGNIILRRARTILFCPRLATS